MKSSGKRIKILLIQPENPRIHRFRKWQFNNFAQITIPYLAAYINTGQYDVRIIDEYNQKIPYNESFELIALTVNTANANHCYRISSRFRAKGASVVMGGPHATIMSGEAQTHCNHLIVGEAEETWPEFLNDFYNGVAKERYQSAKAPGLNGIPFPRWDMLKKRNAIMKSSVIASRGCPYNCDYCNLKQIYHDRFCTRPTNEVICEIKRMKSGYLIFWDDNFFADKAFALKLMRQLQPLKKKWAAQVTLNSCADEELLATAQQSGCLYLFVGLESFSQDSLASVNKNINKTDRYESIIKSIHAHKIMIQAGIIFGFDTDTSGIFDTTLRACERMGIDGVTASLLSPLPGSKIYEKLKAENRLTTDDWSYYDSKTNVAFFPKNMSAEQLYNGYMDFRKRFYSFSSFIKRMKVSKCRILYNFMINLGYRLAIKDLKI